MPPARYEQLSTRAEDRCDDDVGPTAMRGRCAEGAAFRAGSSLLLILLYFTLSIGLTFYQRWLLKGIHFPLSIVIYHLIVKFSLSAIIRGILHITSGTPRVSLPFLVCLRSVAPTGLASGIDVGCSNWALELVTISLYTMTKSTTIIFILMFAILLGLEKKSVSLVIIVITISTGLTMFTYKATQFDTLGFMLLITASLASGLRWTFAQLLMQKSKLGLNNPLDLVYYVQPWMLLSVLPFAIGFEGLDLMDKIMSMSGDIIIPYFFKVSFGAVLAFVMELSEYLVVTYTSSLTLSVAGIFKEIIILVLAVTLTGDVLSRINVLGLCVCLIGISGHIVHKFWNTTVHTYTTTISYTPKLLDNYIIQETLDTMKGFDNRDLSLFRRNITRGTKEHSVPLLGVDKDSLDDSWKSQDDTQSGNSDNENDRILFDVIQRRDAVR